MMRGRQQTIGATLWICVAAAAGAGGAPHSHAQDVTYQQHIAPIVAEHCTSCHREGQGTPFALEHYRDVRRRARQIERVTQSRYMPPWLPANGIGDFIGRRQLTAEEIERISEWVAGGALEGAGPPPPSPVVTPTRPAPAFILGDEASFTVPAEGLGRYHTVVFPVAERELRYLRGLEFLPSDPSVVHGAMFVADPSGLATQFDDETPEAGFPSVANFGVHLAGSLGGSAFGGVLPLLPAGYGWAVPPGAPIAVELHLNCIGREVPLRSRLAVYLPEEPVTHPVTTVAFGNLCVDIPPNTTDHRVSAEYVCPVDLELLGVLPQSYFVAQRIEIAAESPAGTTQHLLRILDWDCSWMQSYCYRTPLRLAAGTRIRAEFHYDNSPANLQNPYSPPRRVGAGHYLDGELPLVLLHVAPRAVDDLARLEASHRQGFADRLAQLRAWRAAKGARE
ncbi:MAG: hypothetical protein AB7O52_10750 [Planctomycetota bacterium]